MFIENMNIDDVREAFEGLHILKQYADSILRRCVADGFSRYGMANGGILTLTVVSPGVYQLTIR